MDASILVLCVNRHFIGVTVIFYQYFSRFTGFRDGQCVISSPELKAHGELIVYQVRHRLGVCLSVNIFKLEYLHNQWANRNKILSDPSLGWGKGCIMFWARSDRNSGVHGNG